MKVIHALFLAVLCSVALCSCECKSMKEVNIVPKPVSLEIQQGCFKLTPKTVINVVAGADDLTPANEFMSKLVAASFGSPLKIEEGAAKNKAINVTGNESRNLYLKCHIQRNRY